MPLTCARVTSQFNFRSSSYGVIFSIKISKMFVGKKLQPWGLTNKGPYWSEKESSLNLGLAPREA